MKLKAQLTIKENCTVVIFPGCQVTWDQGGPQPMEEGITAT